MKVFISWSGAKSKAVAEALRDWLPTIIQSLEPFISTQDISPGDRGLNVLALELQGCSFGILCLTRENMQQPWINFEAGALSKVIEVSRVVPLLLDLKPSDITGPLTQFQAISLDNKKDVYRLVKALSEASDPPKISDHILRRTFDTFWPELEAEVTELQRLSEVAHGEKEVRNERDLLEEILTLSRRTEHELVRFAQTSKAQQEQRPYIARPLDLGREAGEMARSLETSLADKLRTVVTVEPNDLLPSRIGVDALARVGNQIVVFELKYTSSNVNAVKYLNNGFRQAQRAAQSVIDFGDANACGVFILVVPDLLDDDNLGRLAARAESMTSEYALVKGALVMRYSDFLVLSLDDLIGTLGLE